MRYTKEITELKKLGWGDDMIYERLAGIVGLYGIAFFGHKYGDKRKLRNARRKLNYIWKKILNHSK